MDNNVYQPNYQQPQYEQPQYQQPQYQQPQYQQSQYQQPQYQQAQYQKELPIDIQQKVDKAFSKALAAVIICGFPIGSIIAIVFGNTALKEYLAVLDYCKLDGTRIPGKIIAARVLGIVGKITGIIYTITWIMLFLYYAFAIVLYVLAFLGVMSYGIY